MNYLVVLDANSPIGRICAESDNDGFVFDGRLRHPVLDCIEIATEAPNYLFARRDMSKHGKMQQALHIPQSSVVVIHHCDEAGCKPFGFTPTTTRDLTQPP